MTIGKNEFFKSVADHERRNRSLEMQAVMRDVARIHGNMAIQGRIHIVEGYPASTCALAVFIDERGSVTCKPIDPLAISFYEYCPDATEDTVRREKNGSVP